ncbi:MAG TPA: hypothetical protein VF691_13400 [Cytophagaceae bacterium]|jgi:hypothetical protein
MMWKLPDRVSNAQDKFIIEMEKHLKEERIIKGDIIHNKKVIEGYDMCQTLKKLLERYSRFVLQQGYDLGYEDGDKKAQKVSFPKVGPGPYLER